MREKKNETLEKIIELVEEKVQQEGFKTLRFSDTPNLNTTNYDCLILKDKQGAEYQISFDNSTQMNRESWELENTSYIDEGDK